MKGTNFSSKRELIYSTLCSAKSHPGAKWIYEQLKDEHPDLSLGTVYRNIALFKEKGLAVPVANLFGEERLDGDTSAHAHLVCKACGKISDTPMPKLTPSADSMGFSVQSTAVTYFGLCEDCVGKKAIN